MRRLMLATVAIGLASFPAGIGEASAQFVPDQVQRQIELQGYSNVTDIELDDGQYEADAVSTNGARVDLEIDPVSGKVVQEQPD